MPQCLVWCYQRVFYFGSSNTSYMFLTPASPATNHPLRFEIRSSSTAVFSVDAPTLASGGWHYLAVTEDTGGTLRLYLDGAQVASKSGATISPATLGATTNSWLGKSRSTTDPLFSGALSNVAFYTTALSAAQIAAHWNAANFPVNTTLPAISGTTSDGQTLTTSNGTWSGLSPITFGYQWQRCDANGNNCADVAGATSQTYGLTSPDVGQTLQVKVKGTNAAGNSTATSAPTAAVASASPQNSAVPTIAGTATDGQTLTADKGSWTGSTPISYAYRWQRCDSSGSNCADIAGATAQTYGLVAADVGQKVGCRQPPQVQVPPPACRKRMSCRRRRRCSWTRVLVGRVGLDRAGCCRRNDREQGGGESGGEAELARPCKRSRQRPAKASEHPTPGSRS